MALTRAMISPLAAALWTGSCESVSTSASDPSVKTNKSQQFKSEWPYRKICVKSVKSNIPYIWFCCMSQNLQKREKCVTLFFFFTCVCNLLQYKKFFTAKKIMDFYIFNILQCKSYCEKHKN